MMVWNLVLAVHLLAMTAWVGGIAYAVLVLRPSLAALEPPARLALQGQAGRRFFLIIWHAMPLVLLSGWAMVFGVYGGFAHLDWTINVMHLLGLVMAALFAVLFFRPWKRLRTGSGGSEAAQAVHRLLTASLLLGALTIIVASLGHFASFGGP